MQRSLFAEIRNDRDGSYIGILKLNSSRNLAFLAAKILNRRFRISHIGSQYAPVDIPHVPVFG
jgi:hypothetical protein